MSPLIYIIKKSLKNIIKGLVKKPLALVGYIIVTLLLLTAFIINLVIPSSVIASRPPELFGAIMTAFLFISAYFSLKQGIDTGSSFFRYADVNFVFTSPIIPSKVLIYGFIKQSGTTLFILMILMFQIPNLMNNFPISNSGVIILLFGAFFFYITLSLLGMLVYSVASKSYEMRNMLKRGLNVLLGVFVGGFLLTLYNTKDLLTASQRYLNSEAINYIPILGWFKVVFYSAVDGMNFSVYLHMTLIVVALILIAIGIYKLKTDYYEDVLAATEHKEVLLKAKKEGKGNMNLYKGKIKKNIKHTFTGNGAWAIFHKNVLEYRKIGFFFLDRVSLLILLFGISTRFFMPNPNVMVVLYFSIYILFLLTIQGRWIQELRKPYIYLIPASALKKLFFSTLPENLKNLIDGLLLFAVIGFLYKISIIIVILSAVAYASFGSIYLFSDILARRMFGGIHSQALKIFVKLFTVFFIILPGLIGSIIVGIVFSNLGFVQELSIAILLGYNLLASFVLLLAGKGIFNQLELD